MPITNTLVAILFTASFVLFAFSLYRRFRLVRLGQPELRFDRLAERFRAMLVYAFGQKRVLRKPFGFNHLVIFWSFIILLLANLEFMVSGIIPALSLARLPASIYSPLLTCFDIASLLALAAALIAMVRRSIFPPYPEGRTFEAYFILTLIALHMVAFFGIHGTEIALGRATVNAWMPASSSLAQLLGNQGEPLLEAIAIGSWWLHAVVLILFINLLVPYTKHLHIITSILNCFLRRFEPPNSQPREEFAPGRSYGAAAADQLTWKDLFDSFACTKCGQCQNVCPAGITGKPLNPRQVIYDIKLNLQRNGSALQQGGAAALPLIGSAGTAGSVAEDAIWSCTTCGACMEACPVFIEQMPKLIKMRRHLVQMEAKFPEELLNLFENMEQRSNPWGIAPSERSKWHSILEVQPFEAGKTEYLFYVGCAGAFDSRSKQVTLAVATILNAAGVSWGILGKEEKCCGDSLRRLGNEYVFDRLAKENVKLFREKGVTKVITQCPHCFSTLQNDYRQYGLELEVIHHSQLINELLQSGKLKLLRQVTELGGLLYHDPCYLGRHNGVYDAPRQVIAQATGSAPAEMQRHKSNSFCCGAGGGRMWLEEQQGSRINLNRVDEALSNNPDTICVACPYCMTMLEDGLKDRQAGQTRVRDIAELVAEGLRS